MGFIKAKSNALRTLFDKEQSLEINKNPDSLYVDEISTNSATLGAYICTV